MTVSTREEMHTFTYREIQDRMWRAYYKARKNVRQSYDQLEFELDLEANMYDLIRDIYYRRYTFLPVMCFKVEEKVAREVYAPQFRDRIVSVFLYDLLSPLVEPEFIDDSYSCRIGKGTSYGVKRLEHHIRSVSDNYRKPCLIMKYDITGYFMSIRHDILERITLEMIGRGIRRKNPANGIPWRKQVDLEFIIWLTRLFIHRDVRHNCIVIGDPKELEKIPDSKRLSMQPDGQGVIIGDCCSQLFSNIIGNCIDQWMKRVLTRKHFGRYVDDFYDVDTDREKLEKTKRLIEVYMKEKLGLTLHPTKTKIYTSLEGVEFVGAYIKPGRVYANKNTVKNFQRTAGEVKKSRSERIGKPWSPSADLQEEQRINSYLGYLSQFDSYNVRKNILESGKMEDLFTFNKILTKTVFAPAAQYVA